METIRQAARAYSTDQILGAVMLIGSEIVNITTEERMVRAALIDVYEEREGEEAADALMDLIGL